ncbi:hypothetical protein [Nitratireductor sp. GZWM139]|uniref:hypothetical protein n=1 Tax=Nitratireductor sp. GZWM139 TaxID=2950541 RepID=UPI0024BDDD9C|nr:hypothetical protein [Nitratireductor sp. GZWM139]MDJ1463390.1 hypothetical protein [Nitratireductor sp. GZWM139]
MGMTQTRETNNAAEAGEAVSADPAKKRDPYGPAAEAFIESCGGDPREAVAALMGENDYLAGRIKALEDVVSWGYMRAGTGQR